MNPSAANVQKVARKSLHPHATDCHVWDHKWRTAFATRATPPPKGVWRVADVEWQRSGRTSKKLQVRTTGKNLQVGWEGGEMRLPESVAEVARVIGEERALFLVGQLPRYFKKGSNNQSVYLYVPTLARMGMDHELVRILGWHDAQKMVNAFAGEILQLATCVCVYREFRDQNILRLAGDGLPVRMLADWFRVSERHIKNLMREKAHEEKPLKNPQTCAINNREKGRKQHEQHDQATA